MEIYEKQKLPEYENKINEAFKCKNNVKPHDLTIQHIESKLKCVTTILKENFWF